VVLQVQCDIPFTVNLPAVELWLGAGRWPAYLPHNAAFPASKLGARTNAGSNLSVLPIILLQIKVFMHFG